MLFRIFSQGIGAQEGFEAGYELPGAMLQSLMS